MEENVKCVVIGDGGVGKTCMLISYTQKTFNTTYVPTAFDNYEAMQVVDGKVVSLQLWDTAGQDEYDAMRPVAYLDTDVFLLCFSVTNKNSFINLEKKWLPELYRHIPSDNFIPMLLIGTKFDLSQKQSDEYIPPSDAEKFVEKHGLYKYIECSAKTQERLSEVFITACQATLLTREGKLVPKKRITGPEGGDKNKEDDKKREDSSSSCCVIL